MKDRRQGRDLGGVRDPNEAADNILVHPDVRRMLLEAKVNNEGCRALAVWSGILLDQMHSDDPEISEPAKALVALFTPIAKAHFTDLGCETADTCMQVMGARDTVPSMASNNSIVMSEFPKSGRERTEFRHWI